MPVIHQDMEVRLVKREDIDKLKWDSCVHYSNTGNLFGYTWYLDQVAKEWDGLVEGDYESVFPLMKKELRGSEMALHVPDLLPKSGLYSVNIPSSVRVKAFLNAIPEDYKVREINFSKSFPSLSDHHITQWKDYQLVLRDPYDLILGKYTDELRAGMEVIHRSNLIADGGVKPEELVDFYMKYDSHAVESKKHAYLRIIYNLLHRGIGFISGMRTEKGELVAADCFAFSHGKVVSLIPVHSGGDNKFALWKLTDMMIQTQSGKPIILDFNTRMGNIRPEIFNAESMLYSTYKENHLKGWKKWWAQF